MRKIQSSAEIMKKLREKKTGPVFWSWEIQEARMWRNSKLAKKKNKKNRNSKEKMIKKKLLDDYRKNKD